MSATASHPKYMTADEFIPWAMQQPEGKRYELVAGEVVGMAPERVVHARTKGRLYRRLAEAVEAAGLPCEVFVDGLSVRVDADTVYEPDVFLRCGPPLANDVTETSDPLIVIEVASPSTHKYDAGAKLAGYFKLPSLRHYLIVDMRDRNAVHHQRGPDGRIDTRIVRDDVIVLDPPGLTITSLFGP